MPSRNPQNAKAKMLAAIKAPEKIKYSLRNLVIGIINMEL